MREPSEKINSNSCPTIENIIYLYAKPITYLAYTYVKDWYLAEDITQEVFIKVYKNISTLESQEKLKPWLFKITINTCKDTLRSSYYLKTRLTNFFNHSSFHNPAISEEEKMTLSEQVLNLPIKYKEVIFLYYYHNLSTSEISDLLQILNSTTKTRLQRGRKLLEKRLKREDKK